MDAIFKALADPTRRSVLDALFAEDGQTLSALEAPFTMSRIAVMKHVRQLEDAGLIVTKRRGREKLHFLNTVPIQTIHERWVTKYTGAWSSGLLGLKHELENDMDESRRTVEKVYEIYIRTTPELLWNAITNPEIRAKYNFGAAHVSEWTVGSPYKMKSPKSEGLLGEGVILEVDPPRRLVQSMLALWSDEAQAEGTSRVTWEIEQIKDSCRLVVTHDQLREDGCDELYGGWPMILSGLKTWLESGELLTTPGSLLYT